MTAILGFLNSKIGRAALALIAFVFAIFASYHTGLNKGISLADAEIKSYEARVKELQNEVKEAQSKVSIKVEKEYIDRVVTRERIVYRNNDIIVEVVPETFELSNGWVHSYNQTVLGKEVNREAASDPTPSGVTDAQGLQTIAQNNAMCQANTDQLIALQNWIKQQQEVTNAK